MNFAEIIRPALDFWNNPPFTELSQETIVGAANRILSEHKIDLDLTADACFAAEKSRIIRFSSDDQREKRVDGYFSPADLSRILRVESRGNGSTSEDEWREESHTSYENWNDVMERSDRDFVAFYGIPGDIKMVVGRDVSQLEFRIIYQAVQEDIQSRTQVLSVPGVYKPLLTYDLALELGELIDNYSPEFQSRKADKMKYLGMRRMAAFDRIEKWRRSQKGTSVTTRRAFNDRSAENRRGSEVWPGIRIGGGAGDDDVFLVED